MIHFIRPRQQRYGHGDGTSYSNAWSGLDAIDWGKVNQFDTLMISGTHAPDTGFAPLRILEPGIIIGSYAPDPAILHGHYLAADGVHDFTLDGLTWLDGGQIRAEKSQSVIISGCTIQHLDPSAIIAIELRAGNHNWIICECLITDAGNAIYTRVVDGDPPQRLTVTDCVIRDISHGRWTVKDGHGIGIQSGSCHRITGNTITNTGTAICLWSPSVLPMTDCIIDNNTICTCRKLEVATGSGIEISGSIDGDMPAAGMRKGIKITRNIVQWCEGRGIASNITKDTIIERDNFVSDCAGGERVIRGAVE